MLGQIGSLAAAASYYAVFGGVLVSAVVAGLTVQVAVRTTSPHVGDYPTHPLGLALALLTPSVLLFTALTGRPPTLDSGILFLLPLVLLAAGGVLTFSGLVWLAMGTGGGEDELVNWLVLSRAATEVAIVLTWESFDRLRKVLYGHADWKTSWWSGGWVALLAAPFLLTLLPGLRRCRGRLGGRRAGTRVLRWAVMLFITLVVGLWLVVSERIWPMPARWFVNALQLLLAGALGALFAVFDVTLPPLRGGIVTANVEPRSSCVGM
jgi:hypothetical protein